MKINESDARTLVVFGASELTSGDTASAIVFSVSVFWVEVALLVSDREAASVPDEFTDSFLVVPGGLFCCNTSLLDCILFPIDRKSSAIRDEVFTMDAHRAEKITKDAKKKSTKGTLPQLSP